MLNFCYAFNHNFMPNDAYVAALDKAISDLEDRVQKRDLINAEIAGLKETVRVLSSRVPLASDRQRSIAQLLALVDYATPNLKDSIRSVLVRVSPEELTAVEVRNMLEETGFNFEDFSNPLSACHATLKRMDVEGEIERGTKDGKTSYRVDLKIARPNTVSLASMLFNPALAGLGTAEPPKTDKSGPGLMKSLRNAPKKKSPFYGEIE